MRAHAYIAKITTEKKSDPEMRDDLTRLLRAVPFTPFTLKTRDGEVYQINTVERLSVGNHVCAYIDTLGLVLLIPFHAIDHVATPDSERLA